MGLQGIRANNMWLAVFASVAMAFGLAWFDIPGHCAAFAARDSDLAAALLDGHTLYLIGMAVTVALTALWPLFFERHAKPFLAGCVCAGAVVNALYCFSASLSLTAFAVVLMGLVDVLFINLTAATTLMYVVDRRVQASSVICALALKTLIAYMVDFLPSSVAQMGFFIVLPLVGGAFSFLALAKVTPQDRDIADARLKFAFPLSAIMLGILLMSSVVFAATRVVSSLGFWGSGHVLADGSVAGCVILTLAFLVLSYFTLVKVDSRLLFRFLPALLCLFALYALVYTGMGEGVGMPTTALASLSLYAEVYGHAFVWSVILLAVRTLQTPALRVMGIQFGLFVVMELLLQRFLLACGQGSLAVVMFAFFAALAVLVWALCHFDGMRQEEVAPHCAAMGGISELDESESPAVATEPVHDDAPAQAEPIDPRLALAQSHGLTPRETDVFLLLAQGRTRRFICDELFIADGTASTYISHVYDKFGVHSKQELLTCVLEGESS